MKWWLALLVLSAGCRGLHEERVAERMLGRQLMSHDFSLTLSKLDGLMEAAKVPSPGQDCELCVLDSQKLPEGKIVYCVQSGISTGCVLAQELLPGRVRLVAIERALSPVLAQALWRLLEGPAADAVAREVEASIAELTLQEEQRFDGAWAFFASVGTTAVLGLTTPAVGFAAQGGVRRWFNYFLIGGAGLEVESLPFAPRPFSTLGVQVRGELAMWDERFRHTFNLPNVSFLMAITPIVAFGDRPAFGARGVVGVQMLRLGNAWTPLRLEIGYQHVVVNGGSVSGARAAVMIGF